MASNLKLFSIRNFDFHLHHLLIIGVLVIAFSLSTLIRSQALDYGFELNEFDPFFNYRATLYLLENGLDEYLNWHDFMSWYPEGRIVSANSQVMLHITAAYLYQIFGFGSSLYDFTIIFPVVFGSLTTIVVFALVRVIGGTTAGLFASLFFSLSVPIILRGTIGWFKSEPLGLFYSLLAVYLFLSGLKSANHKIALAKLVAAGIFLTFSISAWGGNQFFVMPIGLFIVALPFLRKDHKFLVWAVPVFVGTIMVTSLLFERPGINFVTGIGGFILIAPTIFLVILTIIRKFSTNDKNFIRNGLAFLGASIIAFFAIVFANIPGLPSFRYLNAINPYLTTTDPLVDSVAEHLIPTISSSFTQSSVLLLFAGIGVWLIFRRSNENQSGKLSMNIRNEMAVFALIIGIVGVYSSSAFARLEIFSSISVIILSSVGLAVITSEILKKDLVKGKKILKAPGLATKISYSAIIIGLLLVPTIFPVDGGIPNMVKAPPTILNGGSNYAVATDDWPLALEWIKNNTPKDAVIASWWDYGYWITTLGERTTLADNATLDTRRIATLAKMFLSNDDEGWRILQDCQADYVLIYIVAQRSSVSDPEPLYVIGGGGDESKKQWFMRISKDDLSKYLYSDGFSGTPHFWKNTLLGKMFPFTVVIYADLDNNLQSDSYQPGYNGIYVKDIKYPADGNGPLRLAYTSPSFDRTTPGLISGVIIYEVNQNYEPSNVIQTSDSENRCRINI